MPVAAGEWVSNVSIVTYTEWYMVSYSTVCIDTTQSRARILTFSIDTCSLLRTVRVDYTLWSTIWWRTNHFWQTSTVTSFSYYSWWIAVWSTWIWIARINCFYWFNNQWWLSTGSKRITNISLDTNTVWYVIDNLTLSIYSTSCSWTRVNTM